MLITHCADCTVKPERSCCGQRDASSLPSRTWGLTLAVGPFLFLCLFAQQCPLKNLDIAEGLGDVRLLLIAYIFDLITPQVRPIRKLTIPPPVHYVGLAG